MEKLGLRVIEGKKPPVDPGEEPVPPRPEEPVEGERKHAMEAGSEGEAIQMLKAFGNWDKKPDESGLSE